MAHARPRLGLLGYEGHTVDSFLALLAGARVQRIVDVRALPLSRRRGFSKTPLTRALSEHGIEYVHVRAAGNPFRDRKQPLERRLELYAAHLAQHPAVLDEVEAAIGESKAALLCVEAHPHECHRSLIAAGLLLRGWPSYDL